ncbi:zinc ribbon domain-containing protein [Sulfuriferula sp.]|uniref:zinc ribbon domain-containing protein n=1 Tax=Sulfuriferula sp. TaxID=2025307 RepID=UPI00272FA9CD|nr:zinc ribbon domain-containing protein [Sulfuriferula sp.]MDP2026426.1 zinc ribbon domain-containing protein [Sulfuriferula sp.]
MSQLEKTVDQKYCHECGAVIRAKAEICPTCGVRQPAVYANGMSYIPSGTQPNARHCHACGYTGGMKTWMKNYNTPQLIALLLLLLWIIPGLIFIAWAWGKYKCPQCGKIDENSPA